MCRRPSRSESRKKIAFGPLSPGRTAEDEPYSNAEGYAHYNNEETCTAYFEESLCGNARMITVFGYDQSTGQYGYQKSPDFYFVKVVRKWLAYEIGPDYTWETRPVLTAN